MIWYQLCNPLVLSQMFKRAPTHLQQMLCFRTIGSQHIERMRVRGVCVLVRCSFLLGYRVGSGALHVLYPMKNHSRQIERRADIIARLRAAYPVCVDLSALEVCSRTALLLLLSFVCLSFGVILTVSLCSSSTHSSMPMTTAAIPLGSLCVRWRARGCLCWTASTASRTRRCRSAAPAAH